MALLTQFLIQNLNKKALLASRRCIRNLENYIDSDVVIFYGLIEPILNAELIKLIKQIRAKSKRNRLTLIVWTCGGETKSLKQLDDELFSKKIYDEIWIVANKDMQSLGTMLSFFGDRLYVEPDGDGSNQAVFGMIDPQIHFPIEGNKRSAFFLLKAFGYNPTLNVDTDNINDVFRYSLPSDPSQLRINDKEIIDIANQCIEEIAFTLEIAYKALISHNLKDEPSKENKAIRLICSLLVNEGYNHDTLIFSEYIEKMGLKIHHHIDKKEKRMFENIHVANLHLSSTLYPYSGVTNGNVIKCLIQSASKTIY